MTQATQAIDTENPAADEYYGADDPPGTHPLEARPTVFPAEPPPSPDAPYGYMRDTSAPGGWRAKKAPGRPRNPPAADELAARDPIGQAADQPPGEGKRPRAGLFSRSAAAPVADVPMPKAGVLASGVNRIYRTAGRILAMADPDLGMAVIACTQPDPLDPDALTTGQAWENLARNNPRVRAWLIKVIQGNDWQALAMAHLPIGLALVTKEWVRNLMPGSRAAELLTDPEDEDGLQAGDVADMQQLAQQEAQRVASKLGVKVPPGVAAAALAEAERRAAAGEGPPGLQRQQPRHAPRAKRRGR